MLISDEARSFLRYLFETRRHVNSELSSLVSNLAANTSNLKLHSQMQYALLSEGKRLRPILLILCGESVGGNRNRLMPLALAFELMHTATLVHDDVVDRDECRRDVPSLYAKWGDKAILGGDAMFALAIGILTDFGPEIMRIASDATTQVCDGQYLDLSLSLGECAEEEYFSMVRKKSASLFRAAAQCGAMVGGGTSSEVKSLALFGEFFGVAYQLNDDLQEAVPSEGIPSDLKNGRVTLPYIHLHKHGNGEARKLLDENFGKRKVSVEVAQGILRAMEAAGSISYCREKIVESMEVARKVIAELGKSEFKDYLLHLTHLVVEPQKYELQSIESLRRGS